MDLHITDPLSAKFSLYSMNLVARSVRRASPLSDSFSNWSQLLDFHFLASFQKHGRHRSCCRKLRS
jgi:hypothetical protein